MKTTINTPDDLRRFLSEHWNTITDEAFRNIIKETLDVYAHGKPDSIEEALYHLDAILKLIEAYPQERPLFLEQTEVPFTLTNYLNNISKDEKGI
jgi:hypothetical protein